jgi:predicted dehydrogenase
MFNVGIIGAGTISGNHAEGILGNPDKVKCVAVADVNLEAAKTLAERFEANAYGSHKEMLEAENIDIAVICLPHSLHLPVGVDVLKAGANLFLEKPMAITVAECKEMMAVAKETGKQIFVGQTHQYRENFKLAKKMIADGKIGDVQMIYDEIWAYYNWEKRKPWFLDPAVSGGGPTFNTSPHQIDHLLYLVDSPVKSVRGSVCNLRSEANIDSDWFAFVEYENGVRGYVGTYQGTKAEDPARVNCKVMGTEGTIIVSVWDPEVVICKGDQREVVKVENDVHPFINEWAECIDAFENNREASSGGIYGANVVAVLEAVIKSSKEGKEVAPEKF